VSAFIVSGGSLLEVGCPSRLDRSTEQQVSRTTTLGGKVKVHIRRGGRRSWSIDVGVASPREVSTIEAVARFMGEVGWYGPDAAIGNLLSPQASGFDITPDNALDSGLVQLPDGTVARSVAHTGTGGVSPGDAHGGYERVPVRPGEPVTVGAWGMSGIRLSGFWHDSAGNRLTNFVFPGQSFQDWQWRESTLTPPAGAAFVNLTLNNGVQYAVPSISWGTTAKRELGTGCPKAIIHSPSHSPLAMTSRANYTDSSYSVTEVG